MNHLLPDTCVIQRYTQTGTALNNDPIYIWATLATVKCRISDAGGNESKEPNQAVITNPKIFLPVTDVTEKDRLLIDGDTYEVHVVYTIKGMAVAHHIEVEASLVKADA